MEGIGTETCLLGLVIAAVMIASFAVAMWWDGRKRTASREGSTPSSEGEAA